MGDQRGPKAQAERKHERGNIPTVARGFRGTSPEQICKFKMSVEAILMHFKTIFAFEIRIVQAFHEAIFERVLTPPLKNEQLFRPPDGSHQAVSYM